MVSKCLKNLLYVASGLAVCMPLGTHAQEAVQAPAPASQAVDAPDALSGTGNIAATPAAREKQLQALLALAAQRSLTATELAELRALIRAQSLPAVAENAPEASGSGNVKEVAQTAESRTPVTTQVAAPSATQAAAQKGKNNGKRKVEQQLGAVVVTATRRARRLQDVSAAVTAISSERLQTGQINDVQDLSRIVPSLHIGEDFNIAKIFIRGQGLNTSTTGSDTSVGFYVDGAYVARPEAQLTSLFDLQRVEVLRGPQGQLFGRNTTGGALNIITNKPTPTAEGYIRATFGDNSLFSTEGAIGGPLTSYLFGRLAFKTENRGGFGVNPVTGSDVDNRNRRMGRIQFKFIPLDAFDNLFSAEYYRQNDQSGALHFEQAAFPQDPKLAFLGQGGTAARPRDTASEFNPATDTRTWAVTNTSNWYVNDDITGTFIFNYRKFLGSFSQDLDLSSVVNSLDTTGKNTTFQRRDIWSRQHSEELQFKYHHEWLDGIVGFYHFNEFQKPVDTVGLGPQFGQPQVAGALANPRVEEIDGVPQQNPQPVSQQLAQFQCNTTSFAGKISGSSTTAPKRVCVKTHLRTDSFAAFTEWRVNLGRFVDVLEPVTLKFGERFTTENRKSADSSHVVVPGPNIVLLQTFDGSANDKQFYDSSPEGGVEWRITPNHLFYYTFSEGFKAGAGENSTSVNADNRSIIVAPEKIRNNELGLKTSWFGNRLIVNAAGFFYELKDQQINKTIAGGPQGFATLFENAARVKAHGAELEIFAQPVSQLRLSGSANWLQSRYTDFLTTDPLDPRNIQGSSNFDPQPIQLRGNKTRESPTWTASFHAEYDIPGLALPLNGVLTLGGDMRYQGDTYFTEFNRPSEGQTAYAWGDINLTYRSGDDRWTMEAWVKNISDILAKSSTFQLATARVIGVTYIDPRTFGFTLGYKFE
ncbi:MAG: TonB-dependent receptor [Gammaproteobacteria bacterium]|nr:TonB-dependent receptor [Gammaproteobacteria bacterium]